MEPATWAIVIVGIVVLLFVLFKSWSPKKKTVIVDVDDDDQSDCSSESDDEDISNYDLRGEVNSFMSRQKRYIEQTSQN
jgi:FtsZ-interacting cell division protein ZipA